MPENRTRIGAGGRIVLPRVHRKALGLRPGDEVLVLRDGDELRVLTPAQAVKRAQSLVRRHVPAGRRLSDELIEDRRREDS